MASMGKSNGNKKMITRDQIAHMLASGKHLGSSQGSTTPSLSQSSSVRRTLFPEGIYSGAHKIGGSQVATGSMQQTQMENQKNVVSNSRTLAGSNPKTSSMGPQRSQNAANVSKKLPEQGNSSLNKDTITSDASVGSVHKRQLEIQKKNVPSSRTLVGNVANTTSSMGPQRSQMHGNLSKQLPEHGNSSLNKDTINSETRTDNLDASVGNVQKKQLEIQKKNVSNSRTLVGNVANATSSMGPQRSQMHGNLSKELPEQVGNVQKKQLEIQKKNVPNSRTLAGKVANTTSSMEPQRSQRHGNMSMQLQKEANSSLNKDTINSEARTGQLDVEEGESDQDALELEQNDENHELLSPEVGYNVINRRRVRATMAKNEKGRGPNKLKASKELVFVDVNEYLQPISKSQRQMSTLIGVLARDPRKLPLDCLDWRFMDQQKKDSLWEEVKCSFSFPEGREPYAWVLAKMHASWRGYKSELKVEYFDGKIHDNDDTIPEGPNHIPPQQWKNLVEFWKSPKGMARTERGMENRNSNLMCHHAGSKSFARVRAEEEAKGNKPDNLGVWLLTHEPKKGSKLDDASTKAKQAIQTELAQFQEGACDSATRDEIYKKVIGEDTNGYAKTFGMGVKVPRSSSKRCALEEERAKRIKIEQQHKESQEQVQRLEKKSTNLEKKVDTLTSLVKQFAKQQGMSMDFLTSLEDDDAENANANNHEIVEDDGADNANANNHGFEEGNVVGDEDGEEHLEDLF